MNKFLTLINIELKRNSRFYLTYIGIFSFLTLALNLFQINRLKDRAPMVNRIIESSGGITYGRGILCDNIYICVILGMGVAGILIYTVYMWKREYMDANKSIYTLMMIPQNKFNIYTSKMVATIVMVYGFLLTQIVIITISKTIFNLSFKNMMVLKSSLANDLSYNYTLMKLIPINFIDFIMIYGLGLVLIISVLFTLYLIGLTYSKSLKIGIAIIAIPVIIYNYITTRFLNELYIFAILQNTGNLEVDIILKLATIIVLNIISYVLINKKLYI